jgi:Icc-related predicted phosphoesterase
MKVVLISDTHTRHRDIILPEGDILIHAGDVSSRGKKSEIDDFIEWFQSQPHKFKIFIAGNHDFFFEKVVKNNVKVEIKNVIYLNDSGCEIEGLKFWGSPVQPAFLDWAFNRNRGLEIKQHWDLIPENIDILITHGPPFGILDKTTRGRFVGCEQLAKKVAEIKPKIHVFGHIHEGYGILKTENTTFINASILNEKYIYTNDPIVIEIKKSAKKRFQECSKIVQLWRYRWYLAIPFQFIYYMYLKPFKVYKDEIQNRKLIHTKEYEIIKGKALWSLLKGKIQYRMNWYYTLEEVRIER